LPGGAGTARGLRDRPIGKIAIVAAVLLAAVLVSKSCGKTEAKVTQNEAIAIAKRQVDYEPDCRPLVRLLKQGLQSHETWVVSLPKVSGPDTLLVTLVRLDADTGAVLEITKTTDRREKCQV
jgi:hypothetical protein